MFERLAGLNPLLDQERVLSGLGKPSLDDVTLDDVAHLIGLGTAIKDGEQSVDEAFPEIAANGPDVSPVEPPAKPPELLDPDVRRKYVAAIRKAGNDTAAEALGLPGEWTVNQEEQLKGFTNPAGR